MPTRDSHRELNWGCREILFYMYMHEKRLCMKDKIFCYLLLEQDYQHWVGVVKIAKFKLLFNLLLFSTYILHMCFESNVITYTLNIWSKINFILPKITHINEDL